MRWRFGAVLAALTISAASAQNLRDTGTPLLFAPGVISTGDIEFAPAFEPDMKTVYFVKGSPGGKRVMWILVSRLSDRKKRRVFAVHAPRLPGRQSPLLHQPERRLR